MYPGERERLADILRRLREAPAAAEKEAAGLVERGEILSCESTYPFRHGWLTGVIKVVADDLAAVLRCTWVLASGDRCTNVATNGDVCCPCEDARDKRRD